MIHGDVHILSDAGDLNISDHPDVNPIPPFSFPSGPLNWFLGHFIDRAFDK